MPDLTAKRTLVKSPPELWEEVSEVEPLARHLGAFCEIRITRLEPEHTVAWEGEHASGTVSIESSGCDVVRLAEVRGRLRRPTSRGGRPPECSMAYGGYADRLYARTNRWGGRSSRRTASGRRLYDLYRVPESGTTWLGVIPG
ncbi:MAG: hypothetical protein ICV69_08960 [Thermoleophilaceae bacterium]|nr:hypothetical protein [Thermoleophilaceae bacterium]